MCFLCFQVKKDVIRTDRCFNFYAGNTEDDNENVTCLLNILTTFALNHRDRYCQGMSDLASPLLYIMKDEAHAYICFCALMMRLSVNFDLNGVAMSKKFTNLTSLLQYYDPEFYSYLRIQGADELLFCYRWILLELKREFAFEDALYMLEVLWSSIPPNHLDHSLPLFDDGYLYVAHTKRISMQKVRSEPIPIRSDSNERVKYDLFDCGSPSRRLLKGIRVVKKDGRPRNIKFLPQLLSSDSKDIESPEDEFRNAIYFQPPLRFEKIFSVDHNSFGSFDDADALPSVETLIGSKSTEQSKLNELNKLNVNEQSKLNESGNSKSDVFSTLQNVHCNGENLEDSFESTTNKDWKIPRGLAKSISCDSLKGIIDNSEGYNSNAISQDSRSRLSTDNNLSTKSSSCSSLVIISSDSSGYGKSISLPTPNDLGADDAFMLFLCLTMLLQHRDEIISKGMDANDIQMFFDGMVRKHNVHSVLDLTRHLFHSYLSHWHQDC